MLERHTIGAEGVRQNDGASRLDIRARDVYDAGGLKR
jgi:hypothetical protein